MKKLFSLISVLSLILAITTTGNALNSRQRDSKLRTGAKIGVGTALGAGVGALIGGKRGAVTGALIGGGAMTYHSLARRDAGYGRKTRTVGTVVAGSLVGTGIGGAIGGTKGAGIGALVGGGASTLYALTRKDLQAPNYREHQTSDQNNRVNRSANYNEPTMLNNGNGRTLPATNKINYDDNPYHRLSGQQGAMIGNFAANGSDAIYQTSNP